MKFLLCCNRKNVPPRHRLCSAETVTAQLQHGKQSRLDGDSNARLAPSRCIVSTCSVSSARSRQGCLYPSNMVSVTEDAKVNL